MTVTKPIANGGSLRYRRANGTTTTTTTIGEPDSAENKRSRNFRSYSYVEQELTKEFESELQAAIVSFSIYF